MMRYEQCVRKKLRSLFEYLDADGDGKITQACLLHGLARLHSHSLAASQQSGGTGDMSSQYVPQLVMPVMPGAVAGAESTVHGSGDGDAAEPAMDQSVCEYSTEELIRCVPDADENGAITLKAFLDAEATLLPRLTHLKLLQ
jgi:Ca2+-binding EF-hand superfamily protein